MNTIVIESVQSIKNINSSKHTDMAPFSEKDDILYIRRDWWLSLSSEQRRKIVASFGEYYGYAVREKIPDNCIKSGPVFSQFLLAYQNSFSSENWVDCLDSYCVGNSQKKTDVIVRYLDTYSDTGVYLYGKKSPVFTLDEVLEESKGKIVLLTPWNFEIRKSDEFRVFVYNYHISGICQRELYRYVGLDKNSGHTVIKAIQTHYDKRKKNIPYSTCVIDFWIDNQKNAHILKVLSGEPWSNTESGLFHWIVDLEKLRQTEKTFVKFIDLSSPLLRPLSDSRNSIDRIDRLDLNKIEK